MSTEDKIKAGLALARAGIDAANGNADPLAIAKAAIDTAIAFVPIEDLRAHLDAADIARAELVGDAIRDARFPNG